MGNDQIGHLKKPGVGKQTSKESLNVGTHHHGDKSADVALLHDESEGFHRRVHTDDTERIGNLGKLNVRRFDLVNAAIHFF